MKKFLFILCITAVSLSACQNATDFKRDNLYDPKADSPNAKFLFPHASDMVSPGQDSLFIVKINSFLVNNSAYTVTVESNHDGILFSSDTNPEEIIGINNSYISVGRHKIKLNVNGITMDSTVANVLLPNKTRLTSVVLENGLPKLTWNSYTGNISDFNNYKVYLAGKYRNADYDNLLATINNPADTTFIDSTARYFDREITYYISVTNTDGYSNISNLKTIFFELLGEIGSPVIHPDRDIIYYHSFYSGNKVYRHNFDTKDKIEHSVESSEIVSLLYNAKTSEIIVGRYDKTVSVHDAETLELNKVVPVRNIPRSILFEPRFDLYFISTDSYGALYSYNQQFKRIDYISAEGLGNALYPEKNLLFTISNFSPQDYGYVVYTDEGNLEKADESPYHGRFHIGNISVSPTYDIFVTGAEGNIIKADQSLEWIGSLPDFESYNSYHHFDIHDPHILWIGTGSGKLIKYDFENKVTLETRNYKYRIRKILQNEESLFVVLYEDYDNYILKVF